MMARDGPVMHARPHTVVCYICGREFGSASIGIHEKQCAKKWEEVEAQKPARERRSLPHRPDVHEGATREEWNEAASAVHEEQVMVHCPCGRRFKDQATMQKHQKVCNASEQAGQQMPPDRSAAASLKIKEAAAAAKDKWSPRAESGDARPAQDRRPVPQMPDVQSGAKRQQGTGVPHSAGGALSKGKPWPEHLVLISKLFNIVDVAGSGIIDEQEIEVALRAFGRVGEMMNFKVDYSFASMDTDGSGGVDPLEFEQALLPFEELFGPKKCSAVLNALIKEAEASLKAALPPIRPHASSPRTGITAHVSVPKGVKPCPNCGRNFKPDSMEIHLRSCGGAHGTSKVARSKLEGGTRKQRSALESLNLLLQVSTRDPKLAAQMRATFTKMDIDGNGTLCRNELQIVYDCVHKPAHPSVDELIAEYDANHDGKIQFSEFERLMGWVISKS